MPTSTYSFPERLFKGLGAAGGIFATGRPFDVTTNTDLAREEEARALVQRLQQIQLESGQVGLDLNKARLAQGPGDQQWEATQRAQQQKQWQAQEQDRAEASRLRDRQAIGEFGQLFDVPEGADPRPGLNQFKQGQYPTMAVQAGQPVANMLFGASATPGMSVLGDVARMMELDPSIGQFNGVPMPMRGRNTPGSGLGVTVVQDEETGQKIVVDRRTGQPINVLGGKKPAPPFTLGPGAVRYDPSGKMIAQSPFEPGADGMGELVAALSGGQPPTVKTNSGAGVSTAGAGMKQYADEAQATAAAQRGELKPGERVMIGGVPGTWR
jgi:hypothetical protein